jgi:MoaA/NifB/PqqE/SkfB family radical SAM enzyme|tara:strand:- start:12146 stop:13057 length:912 start_codon:yes stop_codon:yes gene_type:complete
MRIRSGKITIENTNICTANCVICPRSKYNQPLGVMGFSLFAKIINQCSQQTNIDTIDIGGFGEPFADKLLFDRCELIRKRLPKARIFTSSNCFLMTPDKYGEVCKYIDSLKISVYGVTKETYEKCHRGNVTQERTYANILGLLERKDRPYTIGLLTLSDNHHEMDDWVKFWQPKLDEVYVWKPHNFGGLMNFRKLSRERISCGRPSNGPLYIHIDGTVSMCCLDINKNLVIGDINKQTITEIFQSKEYRELRRAHLRQNFKGLLCESCCQTSYDPDVLVYASNADRAVGKMNSNLESLYSYGA